MRDEKIIKRTTEEIITLDVSSLETKYLTKFPLYYFYFGINIFCFILFEKYNLCLLIV